MREKLIALFVQVCRDSADNDGTPACEVQFCEKHKSECYGAISDRLLAAGVTIQKWIPVTERLPEPDVNCLVVVSGRFEKIVFDCAIEIADYAPVGGWILEAFPEWEDPLVTHWMPLPEPPKEGE